MTHAQAIVTSLVCKDELMKHRRLRKSFIEQLLTGSKPLIEAKKKGVNRSFRNVHIPFDSDLGGGILTEDEVATTIRRWTLVEYADRSLKFAGVQHNSKGWIVIFTVT